MSFPARRVALSQTIHLSAPSGQVFPLFEPIGEQVWAEGWEPHMLFPAEGAAQTGAVFTTGHPPEGESIWALTAYEPTRLHLAYLRVTPGLHVAFIEIQCAGAQDGTTRATVTYTLTGLSASGNDYLAHFSARYQEEMAAWERAINFYLAHGHALPHH